MRDDPETTSAGDGEGEDAALLQELRAAAERMDPAPARLEQAAKDSFTWRTIDAELAELAELAFDSGADQAQAAMVRGQSEPRLLSFEASGLTIEVEVTETGPRRRRLVGQLVPPAPALVQVRHPGGTLDVDADDVGRFAAAGLEAGPVQLRCRPLAGAAPPVATEWVSI